MRLLFIADGRSPIALNWLRHFAQSEHETHLVSLFPCSPELPLASLHVLPVAFSRAVALRELESASDARSSLISRVISRLATPRLRTWLRQWFVPLSLPAAARKLDQLLAEIQPDLVHAMRIPYEGMLVAQSKSRLPLIVSVWGNDFTLHAPSTPLMRRLTRQTMQRLAGLHADCRRDVRLARQWGFGQENAALVAPGNGGVRLDLFHPPEPGGDEGDRQPLVINPRGLRAYVRNDTFFQSAQQIAQIRGDVRFLCTGMRGENLALDWIGKLGLGEVVELLPRLTPQQMADTFRRAAVAVSVTTHDGTPNTLLEAMASGCFPVAGDLESLREWIEHGENGLLVDPGDPKTLTSAILGALGDADLRRRAARRNLEIIRVRAEYGQVMAQAERFYAQVLMGQGGANPRTR